MTAKMKRREFRRAGAQSVRSLSVASRLVMTRPRSPGASWQVPARLPQPWRVGRLCDLRLADLCGGIV
jgi:hypothetical protein